MTKTFSLSLLAFLFLLSCNSPAGKTSADSAKASADSTQQKHLPEMIRYKELGLKTNSTDEEISKAMVGYLRVIDMMVIDEKGEPGLSMIELYERSVFQYKADSTFQVYDLGSKRQIGQGKWHVKDGKIYDPGEGTVMHVEGDRIIQVSFDKETGFKTVAVLERSAEWPK